MYPKKLSSIYDELMLAKGWNFKKSIKFLVKLIKKHHSNPSNILEIACGTGTNLIGLSKHFKKSKFYGLDNSKNMLNIAKKKSNKSNNINNINNINYSLQDMTSFNYEEKFDVIFCVFDSINHLLEREQWNACFNSVAKHMHKKSVFIFDFLTPARLLKRGNFSRILQLDKEQVLVDYEALIEESKSLIVVNYFKEVKDNFSKVDEFEVVEELMLPIEEVEEMMKDFDILKIIDSEGKKACNETERVYVVTRLKQFLQ